jgi:hypothetical protein
MNVITPDSKFMIWMLLHLTVSLWYEYQKSCLYIVVMCYKTYFLSDLSRNTGYCCQIINTSWSWHVSQKIDTPQKEMILVLYFFLTVSKSEQSIFNEIHSIIIFTCIVKVDNK